jgi:hypothetical protein
VAHARVIRARISQAVFRGGLTGNSASEQSDSKLDSAEIEIVTGEIKAFAQFYCINAGARKNELLRMSQG